MITYLLDIQLNMPYQKNPHLIILFSYITRIRPPFIILTLRSYLKRFCI
jgi:hypothetical protein